MQAFFFFAPLLLLLLQTSAILLANKKTFYPLLSLSCDFAKHSNQLSANVHLYPSTDTAGMGLWCMVMVQ